MFLQFEKTHHSIYYNTGVVVVNSEDAGLAGTYLIPF
jgi:hypothetical protein